MSEDRNLNTGILIGIALTVAFALLVVFGLESKCERQHNVADCRVSITFEAVQKETDICLQAGGKSHSPHDKRRCAFFSKKAGNVMTAGRNSEIGER